MTYISKQERQKSNRVKVITTESEHGRLLQTVIEDVKDRSKEVI